MELQQLRYVVAIAAEGSFTAAADVEGVAQPTVSSAVRALERELATPLFARGRSGATLTAAGAALLPWARQALADCDAGLAEIRALAGLRHGHLALGATPSLATALLPPVLAAFHRRHPGIGLRLRQAGSRDLVQDLVEGRLDVALVILPVGPGILDTEPLAQEELVLAVPAGHRLAGGASVTVAALRDLTLVVPREGYDLREATFALCRGAGFEPRLALEGGEMDSVLSLVAAGLGAAVVPSIVIDPASGLQAARFAEGARPARTVGLAVRRDRPRSQAAAAFVADLRAALAGGWPGVAREGLQVHAP